MRTGEVMDWRNETTNPQHVGVTVAKARRSNFDGVLRPYLNRPASRRASQPIQRLRMPCGNDRCG